MIVILCRCNYKVEEQEFQDALDLACEHVMATRDIVKCRITATSRHTNGKTVILFVVEYNEPSDAYFVHIPDAE